MADTTKEPRDTDQLDKWYLDELLGTASRLSKDTTHRINPKKTDGWWTSYPENWPGDVMMAIDVYCDIGFSPIDYSGANGKLYYECWCQPVGGVKKKLGEWWFASKGNPKNDAAKLLDELKDVADEFEHTALEETRGEAAAATRDVTNLDKWYFDDLFKEALHQADRKDIILERLSLADEKGKKEDYWIAWPKKWSAAVGIELHLKLASKTSDSTDSTIRVTPALVAVWVEESGSDGSESRHPLPVFTIDSGSDPENDGHVLVDHLARIAKDHAQQAKKLDEGGDRAVAVTSARGTDDLDEWYLDDLFDRTSAIASKNRLHLEKAGDWTAWPEDWGTNVGIIATPELTSGKVEVETWLYGGTPQNVSPLETFVFTSSPSDPDVDANEYVKNLVRVIKKYTNRANEYDQGDRAVASLTKEQVLRYLVAAGAKIENGWVLKKELRKFLTKSDHQNPFDHLVKWTEKPLLEQPKGLVSFVDFVTLVLSGGMDAYHQSGHTGLGEVLWLASEVEPDFAEKLRAYSQHLGEPAHKVDDGTMEEYLKKNQQVLSQKVLDYYHSRWPSLPRDDKTCPDGDGALKRRVYFKKAEGASDEIMRLEAEVSDLESKLCEYKPGSGPYNALETRLDKSKHQLKQLKSKHGVAEGKADKKARVFEIEDIGVQNSQMFGGRGLSGTKWEDMAIGNGSSAQSACDVACEQLADSGWDLEDMEQARKRLSDEMPDELDTGEEDSDLYYYVAVYVREYPEGHKGSKNKSTTKAPDKEPVDPSEPKPYQKSKDRERYEEMLRKPSILSALKAAGIEVKNGKIHDRDLAEASQVIFEMTSGVQKTYLESHDESQDRHRFYDVEPLPNGQVKIKWGRVGTKGQEMVVDEAAAQKKLKEKLKKGYEKMDKVGQTHDQMKRRAKGTPPPKSGKPDLKVIKSKLEAAGIKLHNGRIAEADFERVVTILTANQPYQTTASFDDDEPSYVEKSPGHKMQTGNRVQTNVQYLNSGNSFNPVGQCSLAPKLEPGIYNVVRSMAGIHFEKQSMNTDSLLRFEDPVHTTILGEMTEFWKKKDKYRAKGYLHNRAILMFGPPGSGKSCLIKLATEDLIGKGDIVFATNDIWDLKDGLKKFRDVEPERRCLAIMEDVDELNEHAFLQLLDGADVADNIMYLVTTNFVDRLSKRILRPGRFGRKIEVPYPSSNGRRAYLASKLADENLTEAAIEHIVTATEGFSFGHLRELVTSVFCSDQPLDEVIDRLQGSGLEYEVGKDKKKIASPNQMLMQSRLLAAKIPTQNGKVATASLSKVEEVWADILSDRERAKRAQKEFDKDALKRGGSNKAPAKKPEKGKSPLSGKPGQDGNVRELRPGTKPPASWDKAVDETINEGPKTDYKVDPKEDPDLYMDTEVLPLLAPDSDSRVRVMNHGGIWEVATEVGLPDDVGVAATPSFDPHGCFVVVELQGPYDAAGLTESFAMRLTGDPNKDATTYVLKVHNAVERLARKLESKRA